MTFSDSGAHVSQIMDSLDPDPPARPLGPRPAGVHPRGGGAHDHPRAGHACGASPTAAWCARASPPTSTSSTRDTVGARGCPRSRTTCRRAPRRLMQRADGHPRHDRRRRGGCSRTASTPAPCPGRSYGAAPPDRRGPGRPEFSMLHCHRACSSAVNRRTMHKGEPCTKQRPVEPAPPRRSPRSTLVVGAGLAHEAAATSPPADTRGEHRQRRPDRQLPRRHRRLDQGRRAADRRQEAAREHRRGPQLGRQPGAVPGGDRRPATSRAACSAARSTRCSCWSIRSAPPGTRRHASS